MFIDLQAFREVLFCYLNDKWGLHQSILALCLVVDIRYGVDLGEIQATFTINNESFYFEKT
ncbi:hypothetical protein JCM19053_760 [Vibrio sp. JCM 19053]|nr:hypothetical protein JCM19053_760 [Vibrio sp. JCM 19053]